MVSGPKTLLNLILAKMGTVDTSITEMQTELAKEIKFNQDKLTNVEQQLKIMNTHLSIITGDKIVEDEIE